MKNGRRFGSEHLVIYLKRDGAQPHARFGFIVGKSVGGAVRRNLVKRRLRELSREWVGQQAGGYDLVVRAQMGSADLDWNRLRTEFSQLMTSAFDKVVES